MARGLSWFGGADTSGILDAGFIGPWVEEAFCTCSGPLTVAGRVETELESGGS